MKKERNVLESTRGQGAMEYLMTYGWAILVVVIVGVALWYMGVFNLGGSAKTMTGFGPVKPLSWGVMENAGGMVVSITFTQGEGSPIQIDPATGTSVDCDDDGVYETDLALSPVTGTYGTGSSWQATGSCTVLDSLPAGTPYHMPVKVIYTKTVAGFAESHSSVGRINGPVEAAS